MKSTWGDIQDDEIAYAELAGDDGINNLYHEIVAFHEIVKHPICLIGQHRKHKQFLAANGLRFIPKPRMWKGTIKQRDGSVTKLLSLLLKGELFLVDRDKKQIWPLRMKFMGKLVPIEHPWGKI